MRNNSTKTCDLCGITVAEKFFLRYVTVEDFVTVRGDETSKHYVVPAATFKVNQHYCQKCWTEVMRTIERARGCTEKR